MALPKRNTTNGYQAIDIGSDYTSEQIAFLKAIQHYKDFVNPRLEATDPAILAIAIGLGYRKVAKPEPLPVFQKDARCPKKEAQ